MKMKTRPKNLKIYHKTTIMYANPSVVAASFPLQPLKLTLASSIMGFVEMMNSADSVDFGGEVLQFRTCEVGGEHVIYLHKNGWYYWIYFHKNGNSK